MPPHVHFIAEPGFSAPTAHKPERLAPLLTRHSLLYPPIAGADSALPTDGLNSLNAGMGTVWKPASGSLNSEDTLLTTRYLAVQALQFRLEQLLQGRGVLFSPEVDLFLHGRFDHAYVDAGTYHRLMVDAASGVLGEPEALPVFFDLRGERLVVDTSRFFEAGTARPTSAAFHGVVVMTESPRFMVYLEQRSELIGPDLLESQIGFARKTLQAEARCVARYVLTEPGLELTKPAEQLARHVGAKVVVRALLTGSVNEMHATVTAFVDLWREGVWRHGESCTAWS
jgi:hypothetical protein